MGCLFSKQKKPTSNKVQDLPSARDPVSNANQVQAFTEVNQRESEDRAQSVKLLSQQQLNDSRVQFQSVQAFQGNGPQTATEQYYPSLKGLNEVNHFELYQQ